MSFGKKNSLESEPIGCIDWKLALVTGCQHVCEHTWATTTKKVVNMNFILHWLLNFVHTHFFFGCFFLCIAWSFFISHTHTANIWCHSKSWCSPFSHIHINLNAFTFTNTTKLVLSPIRNERRKKFQLAKFKKSNRRRCVHIPCMSATKRCIQYSHCIVGLFVDILSVLNRSRIQTYETFTHTHTYIVCVRTHRVILFVGSALAVVAHSNLTIFQNFQYTTDKIFTQPCSNTVCVYRTSSANVTDTLTMIWISFSFFLFLSFLAADKLHGYSSTFLCGGSDGIDNMYDFTK